MRIGKLAFHIGLFSEVLTPQTCRKIYQRLEMTTPLSRLRGYRLGRISGWQIVHVTQDSCQGGKYAFLRWAGFNVSIGRDSNNPLIQQFYTNATIVSTFKTYIETPLTHRNVYNCLTYAEDQAIFAYETGNELEGPASRDIDLPADWPRSDIELVTSVDKAFFFADEYDWRGQGGDPLEAFYRVIKESPAAAGDVFRSLFGRNLPDCNVSAISLSPTAATKRSATF
ncbi:hypothetical protein DL768_000286 [Monosporascus sp. mg162]|nr:hypothetical protein DL768_000286 [Monosporascus sp. mg162]